ncbi:MAG: hypothetical protein AMXMBFR58_37660 [Phycisphaerae bacterium]
MFRIDDAMKPPTSHHHPANTPRHADHDLDPQWSDPVLATVGPGTAARTAFSWDDDFTPDAEAITDLFLGSPAVNDAPQEAAGAPIGDFDTPTAASPEPPRIDALIVGHLPVLGVAWTSGFAGFHAAQSRTPIALIKHRAGHVSIDLFGASPRQHPSTASHSLENAIAEARRANARWLICSDAAGEADLITACSPTGITVLTAADDPAVLSAYQAIKGFLEARAVSHADDQIELTIAFAASPPEKSKAAGEKIRSAVRSFLGHEINIEVCPQRIEPPRSTNLYSGICDLSPGHLATFIRSPDLADSAPGSTGPSRPDRSHVRAAIRDILSESRRSSRPAQRDPKPDQVHEPRPALEPSPATGDQAAHAAPVETVAPEARAETTAVPAAPHMRPDAHARPIADPIPAASAPSPAHISAAFPGTRQFLSLFIEGLRPLDLACPYAPGIELALGPAGDLHLVATTAALPGLTRAAAWARAHAALLRAAVPTAVSALPPTCHVIDEDATALRPLIESDIRVHLLVRGHTGGAPFAVARPLN